MNTHHVLAIAALCVYFLPCAIAAGPLGPTRVPDVNDVHRQRTSELRKLNASRRDAAYQSQSPKRTVGGSANAPAYAGAFAFGGVGEVLILANTSDPQGNTIVVGGFTGSVSFPAGPVLTSTADYDVFVAKLTPAGQTIWARHARGATGLKTGFSLDGALAVAVDPSGGVYVGGGFVQSLTFVNADGTPGLNLSSRGSTMNFEAFLVKYNANGVLQWAKGGSSGGNSASGLADDINAVETLAIDAAGNLFAGGTASGTSFLGRSTATPLATDAVLASLDPANGSANWLREFTAGGDEVGLMQIEPDGAGGVYGIGYAETAVTFTAVNGQIRLSGFDDYNDSWIARWDSNGRAIWAKRTGEGDHLVDSIAVSQGFLHASGFADSAATFGAFKVDAPLDAESLLIQYDSAGTVRWVRTLTSSEFSYARFVTADLAGNLYLTGGFEGSTSMAAGVSLPSEGVEDQFICKYNRDGVAQWIRRLNSNGKNGAGYQSSTDVQINIVSVSISFNEALDAVQMATDFTGASELDAHTVSATGTNRFGMVTRLPASAASIVGIYNAASFKPGAVAPSSYAVLFGTNLAASVADPRTVATLTDSAGKLSPVTLIYVSAAQVNILVPDGIALGPGTLKVTTGVGPIATYNVSVASSAAGLFDVSQIAVGGGDTYVVLYGTGIRGAQRVTATIAGVQSAVAYAGPQGGFPGLDQINLLVPSQLVGKGDAQIVLTADNTPTNAVRVRF